MLNMRSESGTYTNSRMGSERCFYALKHLLPGARYSLSSLVMQFFAMSILGWVWEVGLHLCTSGSLVNRGFLHGPWLPIYGSGGVLILLLLDKLREKPLQEFLAIILLCGCVEYYISWFLEQAYHGMKWWDYSDYALNLNGRICAEGLLIFGLGGMGIVYFAAPFLDMLFGRLPRRVRISFCAIVTVIFCADLLYSGKTPNMGLGIAGCR